MTAYLLDTHAAWVSAVSAVEIAIRYRLGKLPELDDPMVHYPRLMRVNHFESLHVTDEHALRAGLMPGEHRDPFDRIIAAQSLIERATVVTRYPVFAALGCKVLW